MPLTVKCSVRRMSQAEENPLPNEQKIFGWVAEGKNIHQITEKGGYF